MDRLECLRCSALAYRFSALVDCLENGAISSEEVCAIQEMLQDHRIIAGRKLSSYAAAVLAVLNYVSYKGDDTDTKGLIAEIKERFE